MEEPVDLERVWTEQEAGGGNHGSIDQNTCDALFQALSELQDSSNHNMAMMILLNATQNDKSLETVYKLLLERWEHPERDKKFVQGCIVLKAVYQITGPDMVVRLGQSQTWTRLLGLARRGQLDPLCARAWTDCMASCAQDPKVLKVLLQEAPLFLELGQSGDEATRNAANNILVKLMSFATHQNILNHAQLLSIVKEAFDNHTGFSTRSIETIAFASLVPHIREYITTGDHLKQLCSMTGSQPEVRYGLGLVFYHCTKYKSVLTQEEMQVERLKKMANGGSHDQEQTDPLEESVVVEKRIERCLSHGLTLALKQLGKNCSKGLGQLLGQTWLSLVEQSRFRPQILQSGGGKSILSLAQKSDLKTELAAPQALAKILITAQPDLVFPQKTTRSDVIQILFRLLSSSSASRLQHFEAIMALTNISSLSPYDAQFVGSLPDIVQILQGHQMEDNTLLRRAATECLVNIINGDRVFLWYSGPNPSSTEPASFERIRILLALCDDADFQTSSAALAVMATLTLATSIQATLLANEAYGLERLLRPLDDKDVNGDPLHLDKLCRLFISIHTICHGPFALEAREVVERQSGRHLRTLHREPVGFDTDFLEILTTIVNVLN